MHQEPPGESPPPDHEPPRVAPDETPGPDDTGTAPARVSAESPAVLPGWEQWEADLERIGERERGLRSDESGSPAVVRPPFPTDEFGFLDLPNDFTLAAARGVADPAAWPSDDEWRRAAEPTPPSGVATVAGDAASSGDIERSDAGSVAWGGAATAGRQGDEAAGDASRRHGSGSVDARSFGTVGEEVRARVASALERLAVRLREGRVPLPAVPSDASDAALLAALLAAMLGEQATEGTGQGGAE